MNALFQKSILRQQIAWSLVLMVPVAVTIGCAAAESTPGGEDQTPIGSGDNTGGTTASTGGASTGGLGGETSSTGGTSNPDVEPDVYLPVTVSEAFVPGGFMGREGTKKETDGITMDDAGCTERADGAVGSCYKATWTPQELDASSSSWAGVFFQNLDQNWGENPGVVIESGATKVVFTAWSEAPLSIEFLAGGVGGLGTPYADTFKVSKVIEVGTSKTQYELDISNEDYSAGVLGGFGWVLSATSLDTKVFYLDDIRWVK